MKKYKKGFIIMVILLVVVIILAVFGVAYYMGKSSNSSTSNLPKVKENLLQENQVVNNNSSDCLPTTAPWIKVLSPNGGEVYKIGEIVKVKWDTCNPPKDSWISILLDGSKSVGYKIPISKNAYDWDIPTAFLQGDVMVNLVPKNDYKLKINILTGVDKNCSQWGYAPEKNCIDSSAKLVASDESDKGFSINSKNTTSINTDTYKRYISKDCKVVSGCNGPIECVNKNSEPMASVCVALPEFVCYKTSTAKCEKQESGSCGWTYTETLKSCINTYSSKDLRKNGETCGDGIGNCQTGLKCAYPCGIQGCQNVCTPENSLPVP